MHRVIAIALAASLSATFVHAGPKNPGHGGSHIGDPEGSYSGGYYGGSTRGQVATRQGFCPPGLAKKNPPCIPPGQAKKGRYYYDYDYVRVRGRDDRYDFYRIGDVVVSADRRTGRILHLFDELGNLIE